MILVAKAAEAKKLADSNEFKRRLAFMRNKLLMDQFLQGETKNAVTEPALRKAYEEFLKQMAEEKEVRARHILVETEDEAKAIIEEIKKGADFAELAKQKSKDPSKDEGGDLGFFGRDQMVEEFTKAAFNLDKGQMSDPVKSEFGWHIIKVEDKRVRNGAGFRQDEGAARGLRDPQGAVADHRKAAPIRPGRAVEPRSGPPKK